MIELKNVALWQKSVEAISSFISEGNFRFTDKGISFKAIDPSQIVLVDFFMNKKVFDKYNIESALVGVDLVELSKIMARAMPNDKMHLDLTDNEMIIKFEGDLTRNFRLPLIDVSDEEITMPQHKFDATVEINGRILREALKDASLFGSSVVLRVKENKLLIEARGSQGTLKTEAKGAKNIAVNSKKEVVSKYSLNFLQNIVKETDADGRVKIELKSDAPMKVTYSIGESTIVFHLAHMIL
jgi:proliferating cell nuclear antigen